MKELGFEESSATEEKPKGRRRRTRKKANANNNQDEQWLWKCACILRGPIDAPKYKNYILPLIFLKRLSDVFEDELAKLAEEYGDLETAKEIVEADRELVWFYVPEAARWENIQKKSTDLGEHLTDAVRTVARENPKLHGVIDRVDFNATEAGQRILPDESLKALINELSKRRLGLNDVEPDILGRAYEYLLRKFAEGSGQSAGEFYTPREVAILMAHIMDPEPGMEVYDPYAGPAFTYDDGSLHRFDWCWPIPCGTKERGRGASGGGGFGEAEGGGGREDKSR